MRHPIRTRDLRPCLPRENNDALPLLKVRPLSNNEESIMKTKKFATLAVIGMVVLLAGARSAGANGPVRGYVIHLDGHCDSLFIEFYPGHQATMGQGCQETTGLGVGMAGRVTGVDPKDLTLGVNYFAAPPGTVYLYNIQYPLATGNSWSIFSTTDGVNFTPVDSGTYTLGNAEAARVPQEGPPAIPAVQK